MYRIVIHATGQPHNDAPMSAGEARDILKDYLSHARHEFPDIAQAVMELDEHGRGLFAATVKRFSAQNRRSLTFAERMSASRVLRRLRRLDKSSLEALNALLDYVVSDTDERRQSAEVELAVELMEAVSEVDSQDAKLSGTELEMLCAVLRGLDENDAGRLESHQRMRLRELLWEPRPFWEAARDLKPS